MLEVFGPVFNTYIIIACLMATAMTFYLSFTEEKFREDDLILIIALPLSWPLTLIICLITLPFIGIYKVGKMLRKINARRS